MTDKTSRPGRRTFLVAGLGVLAVGGGAFAWRGGAGGPPDAASILSVPVTRGNIERTVLATGMLKPSRWVAVGAQVSGQITALNVKLGDKVKAGDLLAQIDPSTQQNDLKSAEANLDDVKAQLAEQEAYLSYYQTVLERNRTTYAGRGSSKADLDTAQNDVTTTQAKIDSLRAQVVEAQIEVANAQVDLGYTKITAPIDGTVISVVSLQGQTVNASQSTPTIVIIAQLDVMTVRAEISEADVVEVAPGQDVWFTILGDRDHRYEAKLATIEPAPEDVKDDTSLQSDSSSSDSSSDDAIYYIGTFNVPNEDGRLLTYMTAEVHILVAQAKDALTIPYSALSDRAADGGYTVQVLGADGRIETRRIEVGIDDKSTAEVTSGLAEGERVVLGDGASATTSTGDQHMGPPPMGL